MYLILPIPSILFTKKHPSEEDQQALKQKLKQERLCTL